MSIIYPPETLMMLGSKFATHKLSKLLKYSVRQISLDSYSAIFYKCTEFINVIYIALKISILIILYNKTSHKSMIFNKIRA